MKYKYKLASMVVASVTLSMVVQKLALKNHWSSGTIVAFLVGASLLIGTLHAVFLPPDS